MAKKISASERIRRFIKRNPSMSTRDVATELGCRYGLVYAAKRKMQNTVKSTTEGVLSKAAESIFEFTKGRDRSNETPPVASVDIDVTLANRGTRYGAFGGQSFVAYTLKNTLRTHANKNNKAFSFDQAEALDMICTKLGRIVNGDPDYVDSWVDIAGYAKLVADRLQGRAV
jgi:hypothetical protein